MLTSGLVIKLPPAVLLLAIAFLLVCSSQKGFQPRVSAAIQSPSDQLGDRINRSYGELPLRFEENRGQTDKRVDFLARGRGHTIFLTGEEMVVRLHRIDRQPWPEAHSGDRADLPVINRSLHDTVLRMELLGANAMARAIGMDELAGKSNYLIGADRIAWRTGVANYSQVRYQKVYPGIDIVYYGDQQSLEYDFIIAPGGDPQRIRLEINGAQSLRIDQSGDLVMQTSGGELRQRAPVVYQERDGSRRKIRGRYRLLSRNRVGFELGAYDRTAPLVIDPVLIYSTPLGGFSSDAGFAIAVDQEGSAYIVGDTSSTDFPVQGAAQSTIGNFTDAFVLKLNPAGSAIVYATYLGGEAIEHGGGIAVDEQGNAYVTGYTNSPNFPRTTGALQPALSGGLAAFVTKINRAGSGLVYSTYLGGNLSTQGTGIAVDSGGNAYISGLTFSTDIPAAGLTGVRGGDPVQKSGDMGGHWRPSAEGLLPDAILTLAIAPSDSKVIYAGTNNGVYKSTDGGASWRAGGAIGPLISSIAVDPTNANVVYAAATFLGLFKSTDGGATFTPKFSGLNNLSTINAVAIAPSQPMTLLLGTNLGAIKTTDGGDSWEPVNNGLGVFQPQDVRLVAFDPTNPMIAYAATSFSFYRTANGGASWTEANNGMSGATIKCLAINPTSPTSLIAGASSFSANNPHTIYKSTDGAANWISSDQGFQITSDGRSFPVFPVALAYDPSNTSTIYAAASAIGLYKSTDGGANWSLTENSGLTSKTIISFAVDRSAPANLFIGASVGSDALLAKLRPDGASLAYFKHFAGYESDVASGVAVDSAGNAYIAGSTNSGNFPTRNALQTQLAGASDAFVGKVNVNGEFGFITFLGGNSTDGANGVAADERGNVFITGLTLSANFPTVGPIQGTRKGELFDAFITRIKADGSAVEYSTYLGGSASDRAFAIAVDQAGNAHIVGTTQSPDFPLASPLKGILSGFSDVFVAKLNSSGSSLLYSTFLGGSSSDNGAGITVDTKGAAYVTGGTSSFDFPLVGPVQPQVKGTDAFISKLEMQADLSLKKEDALDPVMVNNDLTYTLTVANAGPDAANAVVTDTLPANATFVSATSGRGTCTGTSTITCDLGLLAVNTTATVTIVVKPTTAGITITNRANVASPVNDPNSANNSAQQETRVAALPSIGGRIAFAGGAALAGVRVGLTGTQTATTETGANGKYQFAEVQSGGSYTVTPALSGHVFRPPSKSFSNVTSDQIADFTAINCRFTIAPLNQAFNANGGNGSIMVTGPDSQCQWAARSTVPWIVITSPTSSSGSGSVTFNVGPASAGRSGTIIVAGNTLTVFQEANSCGLPSFNIPRQFSTGDPGSSFTTEDIPLVAADFNNDRKLDLAIAADRRLSILLNNGAGGFGPPRSMQIPMIDRPKGIIAEDFNKDGNQDLAIVMFGQSDNLHVLLGDGGGGFGAPTTYSAGGLPGGLVAGDFNKDGNLDLAVVNPNSSDISVFAGVGNGAFGARTTWGSGITFNPLSIVTADFNGDSNLDLAVTTSDRVVLFSGDGRGAFNAPHTPIMISGRTTQALVTRDFNGDGRPDLAVTNAIDERSNIAVLLNQGNGAFGAQANYPILGDPSFGFFSVSDKLISGDLNGDGRADLLTWGLSSPVQVLLNDSTGKFVPSGAYSTGGRTISAALGDFSGDGKVDLAATLSNKLVTLLDGIGNGRFDAPSSYRMPTALPGINQLRIHPLDLNGDGKLDLAGLDVRSGNANGALAVRLGDGGGGLGALAEFEVGRMPFAMAAGDINNDGRIDVAVTNEGANTVSVLLGAVTGIFAQPMTITVSAQPLAIAIGDFTGDGAADLIVSHRPEANGGGFRNRLTLIPGNGQGGFGNAMTSDSPDFYQSLAAGDLNNDGRLDLAGSGGGQGISILLNNGNGTFRMAASLNANSAPPAFATGGLYPTLADLNGDGSLDVVFSPDFGSAVIVAIGDGTGAGWQMRSYRLLQTNSGFGQTSTAVADFNSDGRPDLAATISEGFNGGGYIGILLGDGAGNFSTPIQFNFGFSPLAAAGDFDGDGRMDLVIRTQVENVEILRNSCRASGTTASVSAASYIGPELASNSIAAAFGSALSTTTQVAATSPLPTELGGTRVTIRDGISTEQAAQLFFVSPQQINYLVPAGVATGPATITISNSSGLVSAGPIFISTTQPGIFSANSNGRGLGATVGYRVSANGTQGFFETVRYDAASQNFVPIPIDLGPTDDQVFLILFGTGIRNLTAFSVVGATVGGTPVQVSYAGAQGSFIGLDQVNLLLPRSLAGRGAVNIVITLDGKTANTVSAHLK
jgi:uncharacterized protein (TIGR03437 family)